MEERHYRDPLSAEARAWRFYYGGIWDLALANFWAWHFDQPFSATPCGLASFVAAEILGNHQDAINVTKSGLTANPNHPGLLNNLAYSLIETGRLKEAFECIRKINPQSLLTDQAITLAATLGLLAFRTGQTETGRDLYLRSIKKAEANGITSYAVLAKLHLAHEEYRLRTPGSEQRIKEVLSEAEKMGISYVTAAAKKFEAVVHQAEMDLGRDGVPAETSHEFDSTIPKIITTPFD